MISQQTEKLRKKAQKLPDCPGVYFFLNAQKKILYIGKATSLRDRVKSYFAKDLVETRGTRLVKMLEGARNIDYRQTDSVLEAIVLEADLIKKFQPIYNSREKDDKSFNCVVITDELFPRLLVVRNKELLGDSFKLSASSDKLRNFDSKKLIANSLKLKANFGPFTSGSELRDALKIIRKIFPYRDTCEVNQGRPCFNRQIGLCPGTCDGTLTQKEYMRTIRHLILFFQGKKKKLLSTLKRDMNRAVRAEDFEEASRIKRRLRALTHIQDVSLLKKQNLSIADQNVDRVEAYDIAHLSGRSSVGVMVVVSNGRLDQSQYRLFSLKSTSPGDDLGGLTEILSRRLKHTEWPSPTMIVVDGSRIQINVAEVILKNHGLSVPIVSVLKDAHHRPKEIIGDRKYIDPKKADILLANAEAHRFAISNHRRRSRRDFIGGIRNPAD